jgi:hypothetical protein
MSNLPTPPIWAKRIPGIDYPLPEKPHARIEGFITQIAEGEWCCRFRLRNAFFPARTTSSEREAETLLREEATSRDLPLLLTIKHLEN